MRKDTLDTYLNNYELLHKYPHIKVSSITEVVDLVRKGINPVAILWTSEHLGVKTIHRLAEFGVQVIKLSATHYRNFALRMLEKGHPIRIYGRNLIQNPIEINTRNGTVFIVNPNPHGRPKKYNSSDVEKIQRMASIGYTVSEMHKEIPWISERTILNIIKKYDIQIRKGRRPIDNNTKSMILKLYKAGLSYRQIARELNVSKSSVFNVVQNYKNSH